MLTPNLEAIWTEISAVMETELGKNVYEQWILPLQPKSLEQGTLELCGADEYFCYWIECNYLEQMVSVVSKICGQTMKVKLRHSSETLQLQDESPLAIAKEVQKVDFKDQVILERTHAEGCDPTYTFENFVMGEENKIALYSAQTAAQTPGKFNPLFIYGGTSLGKTHLLQSVANAYVKANPKKSVKYTSCEAIMNDYTNMIREGKRNQFEDKYRKVDILLVDDVHFLSRTENLQEEFFNIFNSLCQKRKQIVLASDKPPAAINGLETRLVARFESGLTAEIIQPSYETRLAVLKKFREMHTSRVSDEVLDFLARKITISVMRRLKGAMVRIHMYESVHNGIPPDLTATKKLVQSLLDNEAPMRMISIESIQKKVATFYQIKMTDLLGSKRSRNITMPRQIAMYLARKLTRHSFPEIASAFEGKNHATILHACKKIKGDILADEQLRSNIESIEMAMKE